MPCIHTTIYMRTHGTCRLHKHNVLYLCSTKQNEHSPMVDYIDASNSKAG